jgi:hypothetical protein
MTTYVRLWSLRLLNLPRLLQLHLLPLSYWLTNLPMFLWLYDRARSVFALRTFWKLFCNFVGWLTLRIITLELLVLNYYVKVTKCRQFAFHVWNQHNISQNGRCGFLEGEVWGGPFWGIGRTRGGNGYVNTAIGNLSVTYAGIWYVLMRVNQRLR